VYFLPFASMTIASGAITAGTGAGGGAVGAFTAGVPGVI
jgi:hypothetical protein